MIDFDSYKGLNFQDQLYKMEHDMRICGIEWAEAKSKVSKLTKKSRCIKYELMKECLGDPVNKREIFAETHPDYLKSLDELQEAESIFNLAYVDWYLYQEMLQDRRSINARKRAEANLTP